MVDVVDRSKNSEAVAWCKEMRRILKLRAEEVNSSIRWEPKTRPWQTQTELSVVVTALEKLEKEPNPENLKKVYDAIDTISPERKEKYKEALDGLKKELDTTIVESETTVRLPKVKKVKTGNGMFHFETPDGKKLGSDLSESRAKFAHNVMSEMEKLARQQNIEIDGIEDLLKSIVDDPKMGLNSPDFAGTVWEQAVNHVVNTVLPGIRNDQAKMENSGLLPPGATLKGLKFTGSDFHKGGKQVLILRFEENGKEKQIVYKPSSLKVDSLLFGKDSVGEKLGGISTYNIVAMESSDSPPKDLGYGYMEFVDTGDGPKGKADVLKIYKSIAASMAMSYYVGLDDVHHENVLLKSDSIQVIDMEATTGCFSFPDEGSMEMSGGFIDQQWNKAIGDGFQKTLHKLVKKRKVNEFPIDSEIENTMETEFAAVLDRMGKQSFANDVKALEKSLAKQRTRIVPIETAAFQTGIISFAKAETYPIKVKGEGEELVTEDLPASHANWIKYVAFKLQQETATSGSTFLFNARGTTTTPLPTVVSLLTSKGVWNALRRGDVPYYTRDLGSSDIYDEENNRIAVPGLKKVGRSIAVEMAERRKADHAQVIKIFKAQGVRLVKIMNTALREELDKEHEKMRKELIGD